MRKRSRFVRSKPSRDGLAATVRPAAMTAVLADRPFSGTLFACIASCCVRRRARSQVLVGQNTKHVAWCLVIPLCPPFCCPIPLVRFKGLIDVSPAESAERVLPSKAEGPLPDRAHRPCAKPKGGLLVVRKTMNEGPHAAVTAIFPVLRRHTEVDAGLPHLGQHAFLAALQIDGGRRFLHHTD